MRFKKSISLFIAILLIIGILAGSLSPVTPSSGEESVRVSFAGGSGTEEDPYLIGNVYDLQNMSDDLDAHYELVNNIDASETSSWNGGEGFLPIGNSSGKFGGSLEGHGYTINGLYINRTERNYVGLIGYMNKNATVTNMSLENTNTAGNISVGTLVGISFGGVVENSHVNGDVRGTNYTGGLIGANYGTVLDSSAMVYVDGTKNTGGFTGGNNGTISGSYAMGPVNGNMSVGGLVGWNKNTVEDSYATGNVTGDNVVGGLVGWNYYFSSNVKNSYATGDVTGIQNVSGLVGWNDRGIVENCYANGTVNGEKKIGGVVGWNRGTVLNLYAMGNVSGNMSIGGLVGWNNNTIEDSYAIGNVNGYENVGGLVGTNNGTVLNSYATGTVNGNMSVGGLVGWNYKATVISTYSRGNVIGEMDVGGLVGWNSNTIENSYSTGNVSGDTNTGGLVGTNNGTGTVYNSFWDNQTSGLTISDGGTGKNTTEMKYIATFTDTTTNGLEEAWDFIGKINDDTNDEDIWDIDDNEIINEGYPFLTWEVETIEIDPSEDQTITAGETINFNVAAYDRNGNLITDKTTHFTWENATEEGIFEKTIANVYHVTATYGGETSAVVAVAVEPSTVSSVEIEPSEDQTITAGETIDFNASAYDEYDNLITDTDTDFNWENTTDDGLFNKTLAGDYIVTATYENNNTSNAVTVTVEPANVSMVEIAPSGDQIITAGETIDFDAWANNTYGNVITDNDTEFTWENTTENGSFEETNAGDYIVTATYENNNTSNAVTVTVEPANVSMVEIAPSGDQIITAGETIDFDAWANNTYGNVITDNDTEFTWENTTENGLFNKTLAGDYIVTATYENNNTSNAVTVTVEPANVSMVEIEPSEDQTITAGETIDFNASAYDEYDNLITDTDTDFSWENTTDNGLFNEEVSGDYVVTVTYEGVTSNIVTVTVEIETVGPKFEFSNLRTDPETPVVGDEITFMIDVENVGDESGEVTVDFYLNGDVIGSDTIEVEAGETETALTTFTIEEAGDHDIEVEGMSTTITVNDAEESMNYLWIILIIVIVLVGILAAGLYFKEKRSSSEEQGEEEFLYEMEEEPLQEDEM